MANNLPLSLLRDFRFAVPPVGEANNIAKRIDSETSAIDRRVERLEAEIQFLREYRTRLTADVVTGNLDIREVAARLPERAVVDLPDAPAEEPTNEADDAELADEEAEA